MDVRLSLQWKVVLTIVGVGILPLAGGLVWAGIYAKKTLVNATGEKFTELAKQASRHVDFIIDRELHEVQSLALSDELRRAVTASNRITDARTNVSLIDIPASEYLRAYQTLKQDEYQEIIATDQRGRVVAATRNVSQQDFSAEPWWQLTFNAGKGDVFLSDDLSQPAGEALRIDLALPIRDRENHRVLGVMKFVIKELELGKVLDEINIGVTGHAMLVRGDGSPVTPVPPPHRQHLGTIVINPAAASTWSMQQLGTDRQSTVVAFSRVAATTNFRSSSAAQGSVQPWWIIVTQEPEELFAPIQRAMRVMLSLGGLLTGLLVLLGTVAGRRLVQPILALQQGAEILGRGELGHRLRIETTDELASLAHTINQMAENLQQRTTDLRAARDYARNIIEQSAALIITTNPDFQIEEFNRGAEEILGYRRDQMIGRPLDTIGNDPRHIRDARRRLTTQHGRVNDETSLTRRDGTPVPISYSLSELRDPSGAARGLVLVGEDLTHHKQLEESRIKAERLTALHQLSTVLTHDLRSPMVGILKALALLQETYGKMSKPEAQQLLSDLVRGGDLLLGTLNDLLDVYRHSLSALPLRYTTFSLQGAVEEILRLLRVDAEARSVNVAMEAPSSALMLTADRRRIQRVIFNLLDNAMKHSPSGGRVVLRISQPLPGDIRLDVEDQGLGIPEGELPRIFDFLYEGDDHQREQAEGSAIGVGLYFCWATIEAHGGRIKAENRPEGGARLTVLLPIGITEARDGKTDDLPAPAESVHREAHRSRS